MAEHGIVHGQVQLSTVLVNGNGEVKLSKLLVSPRGSWSHLGTSVPLDLHERR